MCGDDPPTNEDRVPTGELPRRCGDYTSPDAALFQKGTVPRGRGDDSWQFVWVIAPVELPLQARGRRG